MWGRGSTMYSPRGKLTRRASSSSGWKHYCLCVACCALLLAGAGGYLVWVYFPGKGLPEEQYYRSVYVLQSMCPSAALEPETFPAGVAYRDETESLIHHPDKIQVLQRLARDLADVGKERPKAPLYEAYARIALGQRERAAALLTRYVVENDYNPVYYSLLCESLYELSDYTSLLLICREWAERDPGCNEIRFYYLWAALYNLGRPADAAAAMIRAVDCSGWRALVYTAKAILAQGGKEEAERLLQRAVMRFPREATQIQRFWEQLKVRDRV